MGIPGNIGVSASENPIEIPTPERSPNELDGYNVSMNKADPVGKCIGAISENVRNQGWVGPGLSVYSNSEYVYEIYQIAISLFRERRKGNSRVETVGFDLYNSLTLSKYNGCKQLFRKNDREMVFRRCNLKRVLSFGPSRRLSKVP